MSQFKTTAVSQTFGVHARVLPSTMNFTKIENFEGPVMPLVPHLGRRELNEMLRSRMSGRITLIDASHYGKVAVFGKEELASAIAGKSRAVIVLGLVAHVAAIEQAPIPVLAYGHTPRLLPPEIGSAEGGYVDCDAGLISSDHYIVGDADGVIAIDRQLYQSKYPIK